MGTLRLFVRAAKQKVLPDWPSMMACILGNQLQHAPQTTNVFLAHSPVSLYRLLCLLGPPGLEFSYVSHEISGTPFFFFFGLIFGEMGIGRINQ